MYDTRLYTGVYGGLASRLVLEQRQNHVDPSRVAARAVLSRELVGFFEREVPVTFHAVYAVIGGLVMLALYDGFVVACCLAFLVPLPLLGYRAAPKVTALSKELNDELEREVAVITEGRRSDVERHYKQLSHWRVKLSDWEALNFGTTELLALVLLAAALVRGCTTLTSQAGDIFAILGYVRMFLAGLDTVPMLVQQAGLLCDIGRRVRSSLPEESACVSLGLNDGIEMGAPIQKGDRPRPQ